MVAEGCRVGKSIECFGAGESARLSLLRLAVLHGREKFRCGRAVDTPVTDASEFIEGDLGGCIGMKGDSGECGADMPLLEESLRGYEAEEPPIELE